MISFPYGTELEIGFDQFRRITVRGVYNGWHRFDIMAIDDIDVALEFFKKCVTFCETHRTKVPEVFIKP